MKASLSQVSLVQQDCGKHVNHSCRATAQGLLPGTPDQPMAVNSIPRGQCLQWKQNIGNYWLSREFNTKVALLVADKLLQRVSQTHPFLFFLSYSKVYSVQFSSVTQSCLTLCDPRNAAHQATLSIADSRTLLKLMSIELLMPSSHPILCHPLLLWPSNFPAKGSFQMSQLFASGGQSIRVSASTPVLPMNIKE